MKDDSATGFSWKSKACCFSSNHKKATEFHFSWWKYWEHLVHLPNGVFVWIHQLRTFSFSNEYFFYISGNYIQELRDRGIRKRNMFKQKVPMLLLRNLDVVRWSLNIVKYFTMYRIWRLKQKSLIQDYVPGSKRAQNDFNAARIISMVNMKT